MPCCTLNECRHGQPCCVCSCLLLKSCFALFELELETSSYHFASPQLAFNAMQQTKGTPDSRDGRVLHRAGLRTNLAGMCTYFRGCHTSWLDSMRYTLICMRVEAAGLACIECSTVKVMRTACCKLQPHTTLGVSHDKVSTLYVITSALEHSAKS